MKNNQEQILDLFGQFGEIHVHNEHKDVYIFNCMLKKVTKSKVLSSLGSIKYLIIVNESGRCIIICFRVYTKGNDNDLLIVNDVNNAIDFGKFIIDKDGDINWEYSFDLTCIDNDDIRQILLDSIKGIELLAFLSIKNEKNEELKNEKNT